ncbi:hypothetical protein CLD22_21500 [Rubrivivax gelatinosus]|nr:hypothetical protein [Rubrivivax gelatinosus]
MTIRSRSRRATFAAAVIGLASAAGSAAAAGAVELKFVEPARYTDAGFGSYETERTTKRLEAIFQRLSQRLPDGSKLAIEVLDVDLAGRTVPSSVHDQRVLTGGADWPRITLRYTLQADGQTRSGEDRLSDMSYLDTPLRGAGANEPLAYEQRMIERWFDDRFVAAH